MGVCLGVGVHSFRKVPYRKENKLKNTKFSEPDIHISVTFFVSSTTYKPRKLKVKYRSADDREAEQSTIFPFKVFSVSEGKQIHSGPSDLP